MKCLHTLYQSIKESPYGDQGRMQQMEALRGAARGLVVFGSGLRLRLGADVYRQLSSLSESAPLNGPVTCELMAGAFF
jgi:nuclear pore complex protein Nup93